MNKKYLSWFFLITLFCIKSTIARPISYPGGWTIMQMNDFNRNSVHLHFSPSANYSIGYKSEIWQQKEWQLHAVQFNYLIKRINTRKSQANLYLKSAAGLAYSDYKNFQSKIEPNLFSGISYDWEDRRYFTSYENRINYNTSIDKFFIQKARVGVTPYIGKYGDLHTWIMLQVEHMPQGRNKMIYTPLIRMFKGDFLFETGISNYGNLMFNFIKRF